MTQHQQEKLARKNRKRRKALGLSQHELARRIGTGKNQVGRWETCAACPSNESAYLWDYTLDEAENE